MSKLMLVNPKRRRKAGRKKARSAKQKAATKKLVALNRKSPRKRTRKRTISRKRITRKRNPSNRNLMKRVMSEQIMPAVTGAGGALALDVAFGYLGRFIPAQLQGGMIGHATKIVSAIGMGVIASKFVSNKVATTLARGAITVSLHDAMKEGMQSFMPSIPLGYYSPAYINPGMGYYTEDLNNPLFTSQDQFTSNDQLSPNMGFYEPQDNADGGEYNTADI